MDPVVACHGVGRGEQHRTVVVGGVDARVAGSDQVCPLNDQTGPLNESEGSDGCGGDVDPQVSVPQQAAVEDVVSLVVVAVTGEHGGEATRKVGDPLPSAANAVGLHLGGHIAAEFWRDRLLMCINPSGGWGEHFTHRGGVVERFAVLEEPHSGRVVVARAHSPKAIARQRDRHAVRPEW